MTLAAPASSSALHLNFPPSSSTGGVLHSRSLAGVGVHPVALFSILDHYLRRSDAAAAEATAKAQGTAGAAKPADGAGGAAAGAGPAEGDADDLAQRTDAAGRVAAAERKAAAAAASTPAPAPPAPTHVRVIGTLLGIRTESEIEIRSAFAIPHKETEEQVEVDIEYHRKMAELHAKTHPGELIVGWYATGRELNTYSALIQDLFSKETAPHQAVHLTFDTELNSRTAGAGAAAAGQAGADALGVRAYVSSPLGLVPKPENAVFLPLPVTLLQTAAERPALNLLAQTASAASQSQSSSDAASQSTAQHQQQLPAGSSFGSAAAAPVSDMVALTRALAQVQDQLDRVLAYVRDVLDGKRAGSAAVGRYLIDTVAMAPGGIAPEKLETLFNGHLQDALMVSYLANVVRAQAEISTRLNLLT